MIKKTVLFRYLINFALIFFLISCNQKEDKETKLLKDFEKIKIDNALNYNNIYILTEKNCLFCNNKFSELLKNKINDKSNLIIVNAQGNVIDISEFLENKKKENIKIINTDELFFQQTKIIKLSNRKIDTIIDITIQNSDKLESFLK